MNSWKFLAVSAVPVLFAALSSNAQAASCVVNVEGNDAMAYNTKVIDVPKSCKEITLNLKHAGKLAKGIMGHNVVVTKEADQAGVLTDGSTAGMTANWVKAGDSRVVAHTSLVGGGESTSVKFKTAGLDAQEKYVFFCSVPGHASMMKGVLKFS